MKTPKPQNPMRERKKGEFCTIKLLESKRATKMDYQNAAAAMAADPNAGEEFDRPKVHYVCGGKYHIIVHPSHHFCLTFALI